MRDHDIPGGWSSSLALVVILAVIPPGPTATNQTTLNGMPTQAELPRPDWNGLSGIWAVISKQLPEVNAMELQDPTPGTGPSLVVGGLDLGTGRS